MKYRNSLCLFFLLCFGLASFLSKGQVEIDSTGYYYNLVLRPTNDTDLTNAFAYFENSKNQNLRNKNLEKAVIDLRYIAEVQNKLGLIYESEKTSIEALRLLDLSKDQDATTTSRIGIYNHLGMVYGQQDNIVKAMEYYNKAQDITQDPAAIHTVTNNRAFEFLKQQRYSQAISNFIQVHQYNLQNSDPEKIARSLDNLGYAQSKIESPEALPNLLEALRLKKEINHTNGIFTSYFHLSSYFKERNPLIAQKFTDSAYQISIKTNNVRHREEALALKVAFKDDQDILMYLELRDSISNSQKRSRDQYAAFKYEKESEIKRADASQLKMERWIIFSLFLIVVFSLIFFLQKARHSRQKQQKVYDTESRISKRIHDELANDVYGAMIQLENSISNIPAVINDLENIYKSARDISHEKSIYRNTEEYLTDLKRMLASFSSEQTNVIIKGLETSVWKDIGQEKKATLMRVLKELLVNMKKHSSASIVSVVFERNRKQLRIMYTDNGVGISSNIVFSGSGLTNAENRLQAIGGKLILDCTKPTGCRIELIVPA